MFHIFKRKHLIQVLAGLGIDHQIIKSQKKLIFAIIQKYL